VIRDPCKMIVRRDAVTELDEAIHLCAYDQQWPKLFADESRRIAVELPADIAIEHIGSTGVPGLLAKPIIDLMLGMAPRCSVAYLRSQLAALGYQDMGEAGVPGRLYFRRRASAAFNIALVRACPAFALFRHDFTLLKTTSFLVSQPGGTPRPWLDRAGRAGISSTNRRNLKR
jgi:GrpB-like predicted nucleotidyltransferase (UPF0157 family)